MALLLSCALTLVAPPAMACGCGGVVAQPGTQTSVSREVALVTSDGSTESISMQLSMESTAEDLGLLVPTPSPATVTLGDRQVFADLSYAARPRRVEDFHLFGPPALFDSRDNASSGGAGSTGGASGVTAISTVNLGPLEATTLRADDSAALQAWLEKHDYQLRPGLEAQLDPYIAEGWSFVAVRLTQQGKSLNGVLPPVVMTFASNSLVYPMRMSRAAAAAGSVRTYVLGEHRVQRSDPTATTGSAEVVFAGTVERGAVQSAALATTLASAPYLTVVDQYFAQPSTQIVSDLTFAQAATDLPVNQTYTVDTYGIPIDVAILGLLMLIGLVLLVWRVMARRRRSGAAV